MKSKIFITFFLLSVFAFPNEPIKIISSDFRSILIEFNPSYFETKEQIINNQKFFNIGFAFGYSQSDKWGEPAVQEYNFNVGVPSETGNTIEVLNSIYTELDGKIIPIPRLVKDGKLDRFEYELNENYYNYISPEDLAAFGEFGIIRDVKTQRIRILPVKFDPASGKIKLYTKIIFRINFALSTVVSNGQKDDLVSGAIVNYNVAQFWKEDNKRIFKGNSPINSVLAQGTWVRFEAAQEGFYKITRSMLSSYGIDAATVDPRTIKIYNNGGKMLPENAGLPRPFDLVENAIWVIGEEDGRFDENDYIFFYGRGNSFWDYDTTSGLIQRYFHLYSKENFYWITSGGASGKRIQEKQGLNITPGYIQTSTLAFADWDVDKINLGQTGRLFAGDDFSQSVTSRTYMNKLDYRIDAIPINYRFRFINASSGSLPFKLYENSNPNPIYSVSMAGYGTDSYSAGKPITPSVSLNDSLQDNRSVLKFEIVPTSVTSVGYLDYFEIRYQKELKPANNYLLFFSYDTAAVIEYQLSDLPLPTEKFKVFDITDHSNVKYITAPIMQSGSQYNFQIAETEGYISKYLFVGNDDYKTPSNPVQVSNSNLRGITDGARFIIITHKNFIEAANRLKSYRENESKVTISTIVVDVQEVFNEFSSGVLDVSGIRDFIKYAYDNWNIKPEYVLFFGSGNYDYKNIEGYNTNFVPTWQTVESLSLLNSYTTDDFYVKKDPGNDQFVDFASGRITVKNLTEAQKVVDKIIDYENNSDIGLWRNLITLVADDAYTSVSYEGTLHTNQSETLSGNIPDYFDINKIYMQTYPVVLTGSGRRMPEVNKAIINSVNQGNLILNYIGHGNPELWAHEVVFDRNISIPQFKNQNRYFFLVAATCSFGYFDIPNFKSASEDMLFLENAGSIASLTASRLVYSDPNAHYSYRFYSELLTPRDSNGFSVTLGKANLVTKQSFTDTNTQKYFIFGDPTLRLNIPRYQANIDSINGQATALADIQLKALGKVNLNGIIKKPDNSLWDNYNGEGILNVFDSERTQLIPFGSQNYPVIISGGVIFRGRLSITNGKFNAEFVVPKDISYENRKGKIVFYFYSNNEDGLGFSDKVIVGGTDSTAVNDGSGPEIDIYFDDPGYTSSYLINPDSRLIVKLFDDTGINTTGTGVGHQLEGILNDNEAAPIDFSGFFTGDLDAGGKSGEINYTFDALETGDYKLDVKAWDVFNNFSAQTAYFSVVTGDDLVVRDVYNYPNPFASNTTFTFQQNLNSSLNVEVKVYTIAGRLIKALRKDNVAEKFVTIDWDGRDDDGDPLANGTYLYKLFVKTTDGQYSKNILGKLAVIR
ncbi:MAG: type IX secretion system sortase PorU [Ignavibacteria bacterium]|nr:type IX secretion system sortase PorU [Ignavibacteria bacterium]